MDADAPTSLPPAPRDNAPDRATVKFAFFLAKLNTSSSGSTLMLMPGTELILTLYTESTGPTFVTALGITALKLTP
jgi:hypothetical protein